MQKRNLPPFKIRCSAIGQIMTNDRSGKGMGKTAKSYAEQWLKEKLFDREHEISNKYVMKGLIVEDNSIDLIAEVLGYGMLFKNEQYFEDDHITGTPDIIIPKKDTVIDAKSSWDVFTFPLFDTSVPNMDYWWQGQGYMSLTKLSHYRLCYCLIDTPDHLIESEMRRYAYRNGYEIDDLKYSEWLKRYTYSDIAKEDRLKTFDFDKEDGAIDKVRERVEEVRHYIKTLL